ncbi:MAG: hypothetical protein ACK4YF_05080 [Exilispira sp.]
MKQVDGSGHMVYNSNTDHLIDKSNGERYKFVKEWRIKNQILFILAGFSFLCGGLITTDYIAEILQAWGIIGVVSVAITAQAIAVTLV